MTGKQKSWGLVGVGTIGSELFGQLSKKPVAARVRLQQYPDFVLRSSGLWAKKGTVHGLKDYTQGGNAQDLLGQKPPDVLFITLPSDNTSGELALKLTKWAAGQGSIVITAEKGMLANHWEEAKKASNDFKNLGINATVGGGNKFIDATRIHTRDIENIQQLHVALNGTLTYLLGQMSQGVALGNAAHEAKKLGYAEPDAESPNDILKGEAEGDIPKKTSILFNALGLGPMLDWKKLKFTVSTKDLRRLREEVRQRRFIVSYYAHGNEPESDIIGGFDVQHGLWRIVGGFRHIEKNPMFNTIGQYAGTSNGGVIALGPDTLDGIYPIGGGPGAGPAPTVNTMLDDYLKLRSAK